MNNVYIDIRGMFFDKRFLEKDYISLEELLEDYEELIFENQDLKEQIENIKEDIRDNYKPIPTSEQVGISDSDFIWAIIGKYIKEVAI